MSVLPEEQLKEAIEQLSDDINGLMQVAEDGSLLTEIIHEMQTLRAAIDDLRAEVEWAARNLMQQNTPRPPPQPITSMAVDPCDPAFGEKLNAVSRCDIPAEYDESTAEVDAEYFEDDAEYFQEDNGYPIDDDATDAGERDEAPPVRPEPVPLTPTSNGAPVPTYPPAPATPAPAPSRPASAPRTTTVNRQPLLTRLYFQRHMSDLVRIVGHEEHLAEDLQTKVQPLFATYGEQIIREAIDECVRFEHRKKLVYARLKPEVVRLAVQIIGRRTKAESQ